MSENTQNTNTLIEGSKPQRSAIHSALLMLHGKELLIDESIGLGYLFGFAQRLEYGKPQASSDNNNPQPFNPTINGSILKMQLNGYMAVSDGQCGEHGMQTFANTLLSYRDNSAISSAIIEVNSGGGEATAGQLIYNAILDFKKPVVAYVHNAGSAAYMGILSAKEILAAGNMSHVGSIGAYISLDKEFISFYKEAFEDIYSDMSPDKNDAWRKYLESGDTSLFKKSLNETVQTFHDMVLKNRDINYSESTLTGKMFKASDAKRRGLIDMIGTEELAIKRLKTYIK